MSGPAEIAELRARVVSTWRDLGAVTDPAGVCDTLAGLYTEPSRVYHDLSHIRECLNTLDECRGLAARESEVTVALLFHDAVYRPGARDNEELSARLADRTLKEARIPADVRERVGEMILDTRHDRIPREPDSRLVVDIDLAGLAFAEDAFLLNTGRLLEEYRRADIPDGGRRIAGFLQILIERDWIYQTPRFRESSEKKARQNLKRVIELIGEGTLGQGPDGELKWT